jgi:hypothetical protein
MDNAWLYTVTFVSILTAVYCWFRSHRLWKQMQLLGRRTENVLNRKNIQICEARMRADNSRADVIRLCGVIEAKNAEIEELMSELARNKHFAAKGA